MTFEELNEVRKLKKQIAEEDKKLRALKIVIGAFPHKYGVDNCGGGNSGNNSKSMFENFTIQIIDCEKKIEKLQLQLLDEIPRLTKKIQENFTEPLTQSILLYRYVACKYFKEISFLIGYSEQWLFKRHKEILKNL